MNENNVVNKSGGLSNAGMILGIIGIGLSFIPIINNIALSLGILALILGIIGIIKKDEVVKAVIGLVAGILAIVITVVMQNTISDAIDETTKELDKITGESTEEVLKTEVNITLGDLQIEKGEFGLVDSKLVVTVKNITNKKKSYSFHIEAVDVDGKRIDEDYIYVNDLNAGQTQDFEIFNYIEESKVDAMKAATIKIVEASVY